MIFWVKLVWILIDLWLKLELPVFPGYVAVNPGASAILLLQKKTTGQQTSFPTKTNPVECQKQSKITFSVPYYPNKLKLSW